MSNEPQQQALPPDDYLEPEQVAHIKQILDEQLASLIDQGRRHVHDATEEVEADRDTLDQAVTETNREYELRMADRERRLLRKVKHAIDTVQQGELGVCESCGEPITYERLLARPVARMCIDCKTEAELLETRRRVF